MLKRTVSLMLTLVMLACLLASCGQGAKKVFAIAEDELGKLDYTINTQVVYSSSDKELREAIEEMDEISITFEKKGHSSRSTVAMNVGGIEVNEEYLITAGVLYYTYAESTEDDLFTVKEKVNLNADEREKIYEDIGVDSPITYTDFEKVKLSSKKEVDMITCERLSSDAAAAMAALVKSDLRMDNAEVVVNDAELTVRFVDGKYNGEYLTVNYTIKLGDETYDLEMSLSREFDFTTPVQIAAPADADEYTKTTYAELTK